MTDMVMDSKAYRKPDLPRLCLAISLAMAIMVSGAGFLEGAEPEPAVQTGGAAKAAAPAAKKSRAKPAKSAEAEKKPAVAQGPKPPPIVGRRDPFKLPGPPVASVGGGGGDTIGPLPPGTRGLVISRLRLEGIVRLETTNTLIAVVDTAANRAYFLRENDAVYNGVVAKITPDSVTFRENALDSAGKVVTRDVVLRLTQGPGA